jgi:hypothetical protein
VPYFREELVVPVQPQFKLLIRKSGKQRYLSSWRGERKDSPTLILVKRKDIETAKFGRGVDFIVWRGQAVRTC